MQKTIGLIAHVDAGKTTFSEGLLYHTNTIREMGRVDHQDSYLDNHQLERDRGITIFSEQATMEYKEDTYYLIDTPGHIDFSPEMERTIMIMDYAIIIISAVEGVQSHTETVWELLKKYQIPVFFFINKIDRLGSDIARVMEELRDNLTEDVVLFPSSLEGGLNEEIIEFIAERDDQLLVRYLAGNYDRELWVEEIKKMIIENRLYIVDSGSALYDQGVINFFDKIHQLTETDYQSEEDFKARVYKIAYDDQGNRISLIKILSGCIKVRDQLTYKFKEGKITEKITQLRIYNGAKYQAIDSAQAGQVVGVMGLSNTQVGMGLGQLAQRIEPEMIPTLRSKVIFDSRVNIKDLLAAFKILNDEDPSLRVNWEEELKELQIYVMGAIQLEVLKEILKDRFNLIIDFGRPGIIYKETIAGEVFGYGHFEPIGHYAEVHLKLEPGAPNSGIIFENLAHIDDLSQGHQNLIKTHIFEQEHRGLLTGSALTDLKISLITGKAHQRHTSGGDFRDATYRALRQGLEQATKRLLEPYYQFKIKVDLDYMGRVLSDIQKVSGTFEPPEVVKDKVIIRGKAPVATFMNYPRELLAFSNGKGLINLRVSGYDICHNQEEVIERINYDKDADREYNSSSIFCSKGQSYIVPWDQVEEEMHCDLKIEDKIIKSKS